LLNHKPKRSVDNKLVVFLRPKYSQCCAGGTLPANKHTRFDSVRKTNIHFSIQRVLCAALVAILLLNTTQGRTQRLDHHDFLLFSVNKGPDSLWKPSAPVFLTGFNKSGYNNQPAFFSANDLWLTAQTPEDGEQTDLYALDLALRTRTRVTATPATSEYSPALMPGGRRFSAVRVEEDGTQRLWSFPLDRSDNGRPEVPHITGVGYHCWLRDTLLALFIVGDDGNPHTLQTIGTRSKRTQRIANNIGRCLQLLPDGRLAFVQKPTDDTWLLKAYQMKNNQTDVVVKMPSGCEDFTLLPDGAFLTGKGAKLLQYKPGRDADWRECADLSKYGVKNITRLTAHKSGKLVVVVQ
jgi:hypothetical protein